jgi:peptidoglycan/LPS O-acetylase OafA/YrhL
MRRGLSLYLDVVRFIAALSVFFFHMGYGKFSGHAFFGAFEQFGTVAVLVFFVLSGFVIMFVRSTKEQCFRDYTVARCARLYSVALPALLLTAGLDLCGSFIRPDLYENPLSWFAFLQDLSFTNQLRFGTSQFGTLAPYWSLGFEVPYYAIFAFAVFLRGFWRLLIVSAFVVIMGNPVALMLPCWVIGCFCCIFIGKTSKIGNPIGWFMFLFPAVVFCFLVWKKYWMPIAHGINYNVDGLIICYVMSLLFSMHLVGAHMVSGTLEKILHPISRPIRWLAGGSFTLYLLHVPLSFFVRSLLPIDISAASSGIILVCCVPAIVYFIAGFTERKKEFWKKLFYSLLSVHPETV